MKIFLLLLLLLPGCIQYAGQFDPPPPDPYSAAVPSFRHAVAPPRRPDCEQERIAVRRWTKPDGSLVWPAGTVSTGGWDREGKEFAAVTFWSTLRGATVCDPSHEVGIWDEYAQEWRRPVKGDSLD